MDLDVKPASEFGPDAEDGVYEGVSKDRYLNHPAVSRSILATFAECPEKARHEIDSDEEHDTDATDFGTLAHRRILEPEKFKDDGYVVAPAECEGEKYKSNSSKENQPCTYSPNARYGGTWYCKTHAPDDEEPDDIQEVGKAKRNRLERMNRAVESHPRGREHLITGPEFAELTVLSTHELTGIRVRSQIDAVSPSPLSDEHVILADLKTAKDGDAHPERFRHSSVKYGYWLQPAFYSTLFEAETALRVIRFVTVAVEKSRPHVVQDFTLERETFEAIEERMDTLLREMDRCRQAGKWHGYATEPVEISFRPWEQRKLGIDTLL